MVEQDRTTKITEIKLNGIIFVVQSSFNANCKDTAVEKWRRFYKMSCEKKEVLHRNLTH